jgi:hypothetical protein
MEKTLKNRKIFDPDQANDFSHTLGRAIAGACDERFAEAGMALGDFEQGLEEGSISPLKALLKKHGIVPLPVRGRRLGRTVRHDDQESA